MSINYILFEDDRSSDPNQYVALVQFIDTADLDAIVEYMIQEVSTMERKEILQVLEDYYNATINLVLAGKSVRTPLVTYGAKITGTFRGLADGFDSQRHQIVPDVNPGERLWNSIRRNAQLTKQAATELRPHLLQFTDLQTDSVNSLLSPGGMGQIVGYRLMVDSSDPKQGIFFREADGTAIRVDVVGRNRPDELMFRIPPLAAGDYVLEVHTKIQGSDKVRTGKLESPLTVT